MFGTPRGNAGGDLKIVGKGPNRTVKDGSEIIGTIELTDCGWRGRYPDGSFVKWKPIKSRPPATRYDRIMAVWSKRSTWKKLEEAKP